MSNEPKKHLFAPDLKPAGRTDIPTERGAAMFFQRFLDMLDFAPGRSMVFGAKLDHEKPRLHPTKGWRGGGTRPRGTNCRRVRVA